MKSLSIRNVTKQFGDTHILKGINIDIEPGQFLILVGPSGCGKSTLLNCLAGLEAPTSGQVTLDGRDLIGVSPKDRDIAMVFQSYALYPNMTVRDNIAFGLQMRKVPATEQAKTIDRVAKMLQIEYLLGRKPGELSGGQRQRVAMGRALARKPGLFLFDEPLSNLDAKLRVEMRAEIKLLHQRTQTTSVYVTHDQIEAMTLGDRIAVMKDGVVQQFGTPQDIYERPANLFVAGFIGSPAMNLVRVTPHLDGQNLMIQLRSTCGQLQLPEVNKALWPHVGRELLMGLRPEAISLGSIHGLPAEVLIVEPTGPDTHVYFEINGKTCVGRAAPATAPRPGIEVGVQVDLSAAVYFDPISGNRVA